jgi:hypothetical protein
MKKNPTLKSEEYPTQKSFKIKIKIGCVSCPNFKIILYFGA